MSLAHGIVHVSTSQLTRVFLHLRFLVFLRQSMAHNPPSPLRVNDLVLEATIVLTEYVLERCPLHKELQEKMCGLSALPWLPNSTAASRSWRSGRHSSPARPSSCRLRTPRKRRQPGCKAHTSNTSDQKLFPAVLGQAVLVTSLNSDGVRKISVTRETLLYVFC